VALSILGIGTQITGGADGVDQSMTVLQEHRTERSAESRASLAPARWRRQLALLSMGLDALAAGLSAVVASLLRFGETGAVVAGAPGLSYLWVGAIFVPVWLIVLAASGTYNERRIGNGSEEYRSNIAAALRLFALIAVISYVGDVSLSRTYVGLAVPATLVFSLLFRHLARLWVLRRRQAGSFGDDLLVVGTATSVIDLVRHFRRSPGAGYFVRGVVMNSPAATLNVDGASYPVLGSPDDVLEILGSTQADAVAIADPTTLAGGRLRRLAWDLEGTGIDLLVAPAITDFAGPRIEVRPAAGLPLLHVEEPRLEGMARLFKDVFDRSVALVLLVLLSPIFVVAAVAVRLDSKGPAFFGQRRVGRHGTEFTCWKFRTMHRNAEEVRSELEHLNEHSGILFKIREDPRRTRVGRILRRLSIDELPQLFNIVVGDMSIVGPRPPIPTEVERYADDVRRRLLVKPGLTGLWQVSGRADLEWDE
jgi:exopolysaccharide biosynthesis polyprenyl glycosylphosphotransferase